MSKNIDKAHEPRRETVEEIMKRAHALRAEAVRELFGFGFTVVKDKVRDTFAGSGRPAGGATPAARG